MKRHKESLNSLAEKIDHINDETLFDKGIKYTERILVPLAIIFLTFQYFFLTNKLDKAQETISQLSFTEVSDGNQASEESISEYVDLNSISQSLGKTPAADKVNAKPEGMSTNISESETVASSSIASNAGIADASDYFAKESDKISKYFSSYQPQKSEFGLTMSEGKNYIEAQESIAEIISKVSDKSFNGGRDQLKTEFWQLYWNDKLSYDNSNFEYLVLKFGKQLNLDDSNFENLSAISNKIQAELGTKTRNTFWVEDELNNLRIN